MKKESIFFTITISFILSILLVIASFSIVVLNKDKSDQDILKKKYYPIVNRFLEEYKAVNTDTSFIDNFKAMKIEVITNRKIKSALLYNPKTNILIQRELKNYLIRVLELNKTNYIFIKKKKEASSVDGFVLKDHNTISSESLIMYFLIFGIILIIFILSYLTTLRKLYPLKILTNKIPHLSNENFDFQCCDTIKTDEVSLLALEFKDAAFKLGELKETRNVFLADMMNELNHSIVEGKKLVELNNTEENSLKLKSVFDKLDILIDDFASMKEMIISNRKDIVKNDLYLEEIIEKALFKLDIEKDKIEDKTQNLKLLVNDKLFSVAIKNLIDNAIKYSSDGNVKVITNEDDIIIENVGTKLPFELNTYFIPYLKEEEKINEHFGLGLYIVHNILKLHDYTLEYEYSNGINKFICAKN